MSATCNPDGGCQGGCCNPVMLMYTQGQVRLHPEAFEPDEARFILEDLRQLPYREGMARWRGSDAAKAAIRSGLAADHVGNLAQPFFYACRHFDADTRRCTNYEGRPAMCSGYPWHGGEPRPDAMLPVGCAFVEDVPVELRRFGGTG